MASIGTELKKYLAANAGVAALVGSRIYPIVLPQEYDYSQGAALTYRILSRPSGHLINGIDGICRARVEFSAFSSDYDLSEQVADAVRESGLPGFVGFMGDKQIESVQLSDGGDTYDESPVDGGQSHRYVTVFDYLVTYQETRP
jgi:hypothetical protein